MSHTSAQVGINAHVTGCAAQALSFAVRDVLFRLGIAVLFGHTKVDNVHEVGILGMRSAD